ncbi:MAG: efflux RND transporter periplasmic adaptor subunit [candidate division Zixibacteria bacterium]|nr:efflux RND transporter periplasmic adaptor subunit [candidate division Zixibacteria bacterium]
MRWKSIATFVAIFIIGALSGRLLWSGGSGPEQAQPADDIISTTSTTCIPHGIAADECTRCNPDLIPQFKESGDWCASHNVPESQCELCGFGAVHEDPTVCEPHGITQSRCARCNPDLTAHFKAINDWCAGHDVPESQCELCGFGKVHGEAAVCEPHGVARAQCARCNPDLVAHFKAINDWCAGHNVPESQCELCDHGTGQSQSGLLRTADATEIDPARQSTSAPYPGIAVSFESAEPQCPTDGAIIQFASVETLQRAGITVQPVTTAPLAHPFEAPAEVEFDQTATTYMSSTLPITIRQWLVEPGDFVQQGTPLAQVESPEMAALQGEYLEAWSDWHVHKRERARAETLMARGLIDSASYDRAIADAIASEGRAIQKESQLRLAGMADVDLEVLRDHRLVSSTFQLRAPVSGTVLERPADLGSILDPGVRLVTIGNPEEIWVEASVHERDLNRVRPGQQVVFQSDAGSTNPVVGTVTWISQFLDPHTRTGIVRMKPQNGTHRLRAHEFGQMRLSDDLTRSATIISKDAVQWEGCCNVVFVMDTPDRFYPRKVEVARLDNDHYRVVSGLSPGDKIAVNGSFLLKTELKKGSIGAGCCGLDASS